MPFAKALNETAFFFNALMTLFGFYIIILQQKKLKSYCTPSLMISIGN